MSVTSKILGFVNPKWRLRLLESGFMNAAGHLFDGWRHIIGGIGRHFSAAGAPVEWLDWLMQLGGLFPNVDLAEARKRALIDVAFEIWANKGTAAGIEAYIKAIAGPDAQVVELCTTAFIAGWSKAGDVCGPGITGWTFRIDIPTSAGISESELRALLVGIAPSISSYTVAFT